MLGLQSLWLLVLALGGPAVLAAPAGFNTAVSPAWAKRWERRAPKGNGPVTIPLRSKSKRASTSRAKRSDFVDEYPVNMSSDSSYIYYYMEVDVGTPPQTLDYIVDTGSHMFVTYGKECEGCDFTGGHVGFDWSKSSTLIDLEKSAVAAYGGGETNEATWVQDTIDWGGWSITNFTFPVVQSSNSHSRGVALEGDGIAGLGWNYEGSYDDDYDTSITLFLEDAWDDPQFGIFLGRIDPEDYNTDIWSTNSELTLGGVDESKFDGKLVYSALLLQPPRDMPNMWAIEIDGAKHGDHQLSDIGTGAALVDTGAPVMIGPKDLVDEYHSRIPGAEWDGGGWLVPCNASNFNLTITIAGQDFEIYYGDLVRTHKDSAKDNLCMSSLYPNEVASRPYDWILGAPFLRNVYSAFRYYPSAVGFAKLKPEYAGKDGILMVSKGELAPPPQILPNATGSALKQATTTADIREKVKPTGVTSSNKTNTAGSSGNNKSSKTTDKDAPSATDTEKHSGGIARYSVGGAAALAVAAFGAILVI